jgi:hypothetical protein
LFPSLEVHQLPGLTLRDEDLFGLLKSLSKIEAAWRGAVPALKVVNISFEKILSLKFYLCI